MNDESGCRPCRPPGPGPCGWSSLLRSASWLGPRARRVDGAIGTYQCDVPEVCDRWCIYERVDGAIDTLEARGGTRDTPELNNRRALAGRKGPRSWSSCGHPAQIGADNELFTCPRSQGAMPCAYARARARPAASVFMREPGKPIIPTKSGTRAQATRPGPGRAASRPAGRCSTGS